MRLNLSLKLLAVVCVCTACATPSYTPDTPSEARRLNIRNGDEIRILTTNRERLTLKVQKVEEDRIVGVTIEPNLKEKRPPGIGVELAYPADQLDAEAGMTDLADAGGARAGGDGDREPDR